MTMPKRILGWSTRLTAAGAVLAMAAGVGAATMPAQAATYGTATVTPATHLQSGDEVAVAISGFPANTVAYGVQCDQRVATTGDNTYCDLTNLAIISTDGNGEGSATFTVTSGADFASSNGDGVCDAQNLCYLAISTQGQQPEDTQAVATLEFGARTTTQAGRGYRSVPAGRALELSVRVRSSAGGVPSGSVTVKDGRKTVRTKALSDSGTASFRLKLTKGKHRLKVRYGGDPSFTVSSDAVTVRVKRRH